MLDNAIPQGFEDAVELRRKNRETVVKYMNTKGQDRLRRHELAAATLLVRLDCSSELAIEEFEAFTTSCATSCSWRAVPATSRIDSWIRSTKRLK